MKKREAFLKVGIWWPFYTRTEWSLPPEVAGKISAKRRELK